jgi:hypothetical protein
MPTPEKHALLGASSAARWMACTPSARLTEHCPETTSVYAEEGRLAHSLSELKLRKIFGTGCEKLSAKAYKAKLAEIKADKLYSEEMEQCSEEYVLYIQSVVAQCENPAVAFEQMVCYDKYVPEGFGTADCIVLDSDTINVCDYKHGKGVAVDATDNPQLKLYAIGAIERYKAFYSGIEKVRLHIIQPRAGGASSWETTTKELYDWANNVVKPLAEKAYKGDGECNPGEAQCRFCGIRDTCRARAKLVRDIAALPTFENEPPELTSDEIGEALTMAQRVADWVEKLKAYASKTLEDGGSIAGYKLVAGRTTRVWDDQSRAFDDLRANGVDDAMLYERTPLSVAKTEKMLGKKRFSEIASDHVVQSEGKPTLVPESDPRAAWSKSSGDIAEMIKHKKGE